ncbi:MAG: hypothetical protein ABSB95_03395 [Dissulfurispiraceae bacterium]|jgi:H+/Cl- antiporter ClcA
MDACILYFLYVCIVVAFALGVVLLFFPKHLHKLNQWANKFIAGTDQYVFAYRLIVGVLLLLLCLFLFSAIQALHMKIYG